MDMASGLDPQTLSVGLLIGRLVVGLLIAAHGAQKLFGWFGGHGLEGTGQFFGSLGFRPGRTLLEAPRVTLIALAVGVIGGTLNLSVRRNAPAGPTV